MTEKVEESAFIAGRTGTLHRSLQSKARKGMERQHSPPRVHFEEPNWDPR
jgi:hypothetical protein